MDAIKETKFDSVVDSAVDSAVDLAVDSVVDFTPPNEELVETKLNDNEILPAPQLEKVEIKPENVLLDTFDILYNHFKSINSDKITPANIVVIVTQLVQVTEKYKQLTGHQKKTLVINVIKKLVNTQVDNESNRKTLNTIIDFTVPTVIDNLVNAINGNLKFDKEKVKSFFRKYLCCLCN
jgi:hypothetical protein